MLLYIIRHAEPHYPTDSLTENGVKQAAALAERLCSHGLDEAYSSPLGRAIQTAQPTCERLSLPYKIEDWMSESTAWGEFSVIDAKGTHRWAFQCQNAELLKNGDPTRGDWHAHPEFSACKAAEEGYRRVADHSDEFIARLGYRRDGRVYRDVSPNERRVAAFCHAGFGSIWLSHLMSVPPLIFWAGFDIAHSGVTVLEFKNSPDGLTAPMCLCFSDISHIYKAGLHIEAAIGFMKAAIS